MMRTLIIIICFLKYSKFNDVAKMLGVIPAECQKILSI